ncbi:hypothetical protein GGS20DRAFT_585996 [Poronia punctata]|nr:hypothetical protein GGS20DRAFT_585996 [Poronia punctata]
MPPAGPQKRKLPFDGLQRRVRARKEPEPEPEEFSDDDPQAEGNSEEEDDMSDSQASEQSQSDSGSESGSEDESDEEEEEEEEEDPTSLVAQVSFGALAKAQASLPNIKRKKGATTTTKNSKEDEEEDEEEKAKREAQPWLYPDTSSKSKPAKPPKRSSKHAPTEMSSKRQVTRRREVVATHIVPARDPRFSSAAAHSDAPTDEIRLRKAYSFLDEYRDREMADLRASLKKAKTTREKEGIARTLKSMQSKKEAQMRRDQEREVVARHRRQEKELVAQGKKSAPFYLKKAELKKQVLLDRYQGMKKRDVDKSIERRRKKLTSKEKKNLPWTRREVGGDS